MKRIEVKSNDIIIGYSYDGGESFEFIDNEEAKRIKSVLFESQPIFVSSRRRGKVNKDGNIEQINDINEMVIYQ